MNSSPDDRFRLATPRLLLRDFEASDIPIFAAMRSPQTHPWHSEEDLTPERSAQLAQWFIDWSREVPRTRYQLAVVERASNTLIGTLGVRRLANPEEASFGCELAGSVRGNGYGIEAAQALFDYIFDHWTLAAIRADTLVDNGPALKLAQRLGFEAVENEAGPIRDIRGQPVSSKVLVLTRQTYQQSVGR